MTRSVRNADIMYLTILIRILPYLLILIKIENWFIWMSDSLSIIQISHKPPIFANIYRNIHDEQPLPPEIGAQSLPG